MRGLETVTDTVDWYKIYKHKIFLWNSIIDSDRSRDPNKARKKWSVYVFIKSWSLSSHSNGTRHDPEPDWRRRRRNIWRIGVTLIDTTLRRIFINLFFISGIDSGKYCVLPSNMTRCFTSASHLLTADVHWYTWSIGCHPPGELSATRQDCRILGRVFYTLTPLNEWLIQRR